MRLTAPEIEGIVSALRLNIDRWSGTLYLFGSRVYAEKKGGDIDLLLVVPSTHVITAKNETPSMIDKIHSAIGEQRIDLTIAALETRDHDPFLVSIHHELIALYDSKGAQKV